MSREKLLELAQKISWEGNITEFLTNYSRPEAFADYPKLYVAADNFVKAFDHLEFVWDELLEENDISKEDYEI